MKVTPSMPDTDPEFAATIQHINATYSEWSKFKTSTLAMCCKNNEHNFYILGEISNCSWLWECTICGMRRECDTIDGNDNPHYHDYVKIGIN